MKENCFTVFGSLITRIFGCKWLIVVAILLQFSSALAQQKNTDLDNCKGPVPDGAFNCKGFVWCTKGGDYMCCVANKEGGKDCEQIEAKAGGGTKGVAGPVRGGTLAPVTGQNKPPTTTAGQTNLGNKIQTSQGYVFDKGPKKNQVTARKAGARPGGLGASTDCGCSSSSGTCTLMVTGGIALCSKGAGDTCKDDCTFTTTVPSATGGIMMRSK